MAACRILLLKFLLYTSIWTQTSGCRGRVSTIGPSIGDRRALKAGKTATTIIYHWKRTSSGDTLEGAKLFLRLCWPHIVVRVFDYGLLAWVRRYPSLSICVRI
jgi:hypothetical protein